MTGQPITTERDTTTTISGEDEEATPPSGTSSGSAVRRSLRRAKSLIGLTSTGVAAGRSGTLALSAGKRQRASVGVTKTNAKAKAKSTAKKATNACALSDDVSDDEVIGAIAAPSLSSSSPISTSLKRAHVLFGSGKCAPLRPPTLFFFWSSLGWLIDWFFRDRTDDSMAAADMDLSDGATPPASCDSSDDDLHLLGGLGRGPGRVTAHHIFSPAPRRLSSRFFSAHDMA
jgi:hypothetical protein